MPPPQKAAKKAAAKHVDPKQQEMKDLRRAYEHLGRVEILQKSIVDTHPGVSILASLAQKELNAGHIKDAADLLRAAEHFSFAALGATAAKPSDLTPKLVEAINKEFNHLLDKAKEHWEHEDEKDRHPEVRTLYLRSLEEAETAHEQHHYRQALETARGAEALAHVKKHGAGQLSAGKNHPELATT